MTQLSQSLRKVTESFEVNIPRETYDDIELSDEEKQQAIEEALFLARKRKAAMLREREYWERVEKGNEVPKYTAQQLFDKLIDDMRKVIPKDEKSGKPGFILDADNTMVMEKLCEYFSDDPGFEVGNFSLKKGIALLGPVGCGKTTLMRWFKSNQKKSYCYHSCRSITHEFMDVGFTVIEKYSKYFILHEDKFKTREYGVCFDDLGTDEEKKSFGNNVNVLGEIMFCRYDQLPFIATHYTSNISAKQVEEIYGARLRSRFREMFNLITFSTTSKDRRV